MVESNPEVRSTRTRLVSLAYLAVVGFAVSFAVIWFVGALVEAHGPSSTSRGRVLSRDVEEYQARVCRSGSSRFCSYEDRERHTVIGERDDGSTWLVTSEGAFSYLARDYKMREAYLWPINADQQGTPQQVRHVIELVRKNGIPVVFSESTVSDRAAKQVAKLLAEQLPEHIL